MDKTTLKRIVINDNLRASVLHTQDKQNGRAHGISIMFFIQGPQSRHI